MIIIETLITETGGHFPQFRGNVTLEVTLNKAVHVMPYLIVYQDSFYMDTPDPVISYTVHPFASTGNTFLFGILNQEQPKYFSLVIKEGDGIRYLIRNYHFEPDDDIVVKVDNSEGRTADCHDFSGRGAAKYRCLTEIRNRILYDEVQLSPQFNPIYDYNTDNRSMRSIHLAMQILKTFKSEMSAYSYELLKVDIIAKEWRELIWNFQQKMTTALANDDTHAYLRLCFEYKSKLELNFEMPVSPIIQYDSLAYPHFMVDKTVFAYMKRYIKINFVKIYYLIYLGKDHNLRDKMIVILLMSYKAEMKGNYNSLLKHALAHLKNKECLERLMGIQLLSLKAG